MYSIVSLMAFRFQLRIQLRCPLARQLRSLRQCFAIMFLLTPRFSTSDFFMLLRFNPRDYRLPKPMTIIFGFD